MSHPCYPDAAAWQRDRTRFNHDWLMVSFLTFLQAWAGELDTAGGIGIAPEAEAHLRQWPPHRERLLALLDAAEWALGPAARVAATPAGADPARVDLLMQAQAVWRERSGIRHHVADLGALVAEADALVERLLTRQATTRAGDTLYRLFLQISRRLSGLPSAGYVA